MQGPRHLSGTLPVCTRRFPESLQRSPDRFAVLRRGFHHRFLGLLLDQPLRKQLQLLGVATLPPSLKLVFVVDFDVSHNYGQLLLMDIDSRYPIRHRLPPGGSGERAADFIKQGLGLSPLPQGERPRTIYSLYHARSGSHTLTASASPLSNQSRRSSHCGVLPGSGPFSSGFAGRRPHITLWAVPVAAAVVGDGRTVSAVGALIEMPTQGSGATARNGSQHFEVLPGDPLAA